MFKRLKRLCNKFLGLFVKKSPPFEWPSVEKSHYEEAHDK